MNKHLKRLLMGLGVGAAFGTAWVLYVRTQPALGEGHTAIVDRFGTLHTLDATIAHQTLAARHGLSPHYDSLTQSTRQFQQVLAALSHDLAPLSAEHAELSRALDSLNVSARERSRSVERFKANNSVLKNSLFYLPSAGQHVIDELTSSGEVSAATSREPVQVVSDLVQLTLVQNLLGGREETAKVGAQLARAEKLGAGLPDSVQERFELFLAHARTASVMQERVDPIVREEVLGAPVASKLSALEQRYGQLFDAALSEAAWYRAVLYGWSTLLLIAVLLAALKLRSVYASLEKLVVERTRELEQALKELWGEMQLAKKIQTALVPRTLSLRDCDVAAVMHPADQVGGDYYDVFEIDGVEWVLIGDVSGHGVPAGLVMMMCQTSVHSVLAARPDIGPHELLATVNRTLTQNIERLGEDKYMTVSALRRESDGTFKVAGMHQDLLVYRAQSKSVEHLHAQGTWLGIASDIRDLNPVRTVKLGPGDVLVLYTDGITEARKDNCMFEVEGLKRSVLEHGGGSATHMLEGILKSLEGYEVSDDVAAVIIKQLEPVRRLRESAA